jgi:hypothetical protein
MVTYILSLDQQYQPVVERIVQTAKRRRKGQPAASRQFVTRVSRSGQIVCTDEPYIDPHEREVNEYEYTPSGYRLASV